MCSNQEFSGQGYFGLNGNAFTHPEAGQDLFEETSYLKTQPPEKRKKGFGTADASKYDEFTQTLRVERHKSVIRKELSLTKSTVMFDVGSQSLSNEEDR